MMLSEILREITESERAEAALLGLGDLVLLAAVEQEAVLFEESTGEYVAGAVRRFCHLGSSEDWLAIMGKLERGEAPAGDFLRFVIRWALDRDASEREGEGSPCCSHGACSDGHGHGHDQTAR